MNGGEEGRGGGVGGGGGSERASLAALVQYKQYRAQWRPIRDAVAFNLLHVSSACMAQHPP